MIQLDYIQEIINNLPIFSTGVGTMILAISAIIVSMQTQHNVKLEYLASFLPQSGKNYDAKSCNLYLENVGRGIAIRVELKITGRTKDGPFRRRCRSLLRFCHLHPKDEAPKTWFSNAIRPEEKFHTDLKLTDYEWWEITGKYRDATGGKHDDVHIWFCVESDSSLEIKKFKM